jgi:hypothetical protein
MESSYLAVKVRTYDRRSEVWLFVVWPPLIGRKKYQEENGIWPEKALAIDLN